MKKYIGAVFLFITLLAFSAQTAHASFFSNLINTILGVKHTSLGAMAVPINDDSVPAGGSAVPTPIAKPAPTPVPVSIPIVTKAITPTTTTVTSTTPPTSKPTIAPVSVPLIPSIPTTDVIPQTASSAGRLPTSVPAKPIAAPVSNPLTSPQNTILPPSNPAVASSNFPAGCTSAMGYSSTTGQSCAGSSAGQTASSLKVVSPNGGEAFAPGQQIAVSWTSTGYSNTDMLTVYLAQKNTLDQYVTVTSLGKALVSAKQATFTIPSNVPTGNNYVIEIAATPASGFDIDQSDATFTIAASGTTVYPAGCTSSVGYSVTTGMSCSGTSNIAPALIVTKDVNDYNDRVVAGQATAATQAIPLATVDLTAQGSDVTLNRLPVHLTVTNSGTGASQAGTIINVLRIYNSAGMQIDSESVPANANAQVIFSNLSLHIAKGATQVLTIKGDLRPMDGTIVTNGATARITIAASDTAAIQAYDGNNNVINGNSLAGSTTGGTITFYVNGIQVSSTTPGTAVASTIGGSQVHNTLSFTIPFSVTAFGQNAYIPSFATPATAASADRAIQFCIDTATGACQAVGSSVLTYAGNDTLTIDNNGNYLIPVGQTKNFVLQVTYTANGAASYRASLLSVNWNNTDSSYLFNIFPVGLNSNAFRTNYVSAQAVVHPTTQSGCNGTKYSATTGQLCVYSQ